MHKTRFILIVLLIVLLGAAGVRAKFAASPAAAVPRAVQEGTGTPVRPAVSPAGQGEGAPPAVTHGPLSGEVTDTSIVLWARGSGVGELAFALAPVLTSTAATTETVTEAAAPSSPVAATTPVTADDDFTGRIRFEDLEPDRGYAFTVTHVVGSAESAPVTGTFRTAPVEAAAFDFVFSACLGGQGYCRDPENGWQIFETMQAQEPDFFILTGDSIYADTTCPAPENVPGAEGPYRELEGFRTRYKYHLEDPHYARFLAQTPVYVTWDDHEVINDFGGPALASINPDLFFDGLTAYFEYWPLSGTEGDPFQIYRSFTYGDHAEFFLLDTRSYRDPNVNWDPDPNTLEPKTMLGEAQFQWLQAGLASSEATWKFVVTSVPLSYPTGFPQPQVDGRDGWADFTEKSGYETELMSLLFYLESAGIENLVFLAGDTHWPYAISYDPDRNGEPNFYEFGASPMSAIPLPPAEPDQTFNPDVLYAEGEFQGTLFNFGQVAVAEDGALTFRVLDWEGEERYALTLEPR